MIYVTSISMQCTFKHHQCEQMDFTSLVPKVASIDITLVSLYETIDYNYDGVWISIVNVTLIPLTSPTFGK
jgi:hypothetical protein